MPEALQRRLAETPRRLERLRKSGEAVAHGWAGALSAGARRLTLGYTAEISVNEEHVIVGQRVTVNRCDVPALVPMVKEVERQARARPEKVLAERASTATRMYLSCKSRAWMYICRIQI